MNAEIQHVVIGIFLSMIAVAILLATYSAIRQYNLFIKTSNPYRKYCKICQARYELVEDHTGYYWEIQSVAHSHCRCHNYSKYPVEIEEKTVKCCCQQCLQEKNLPNQPNTPKENEI